MAPDVKPPHQERDVRIDMLKGFGIICVVVTHVAIYEQHFSSLWVKTIYSFHMPLFFFLSGYLSVIRQNYSHFFIEKFGQLLIPYAVYFAGIFVVNKLVGRDDCGWQCLLLGGRYAYNYLGVFWFVPVLFLTQQVGNFLLFRFSVPVNMLIIVGMLCVSFLNDQYFDMFKFPHNVNVVLAAVPFYFCGFLVRHHKMVVKIGGALIAAACGAGLVIAGYPNYYDMKNAFYGIPFVTFGSALASVAVLVYVFSNLPRWGLLVDIGKASLVIMYLHQGIQIFIFDHFTESIALRLVVATFVPLSVYYLSLRWSVTRALLLGSGRDLAGLRSYLMVMLR